MSTISIWSWQAPPSFASASPYPWFTQVSADSKQPFAPRAQTPPGAQTATQQHVGNLANAAIASGPAFSAFREFSL